MADQKLAPCACPTAVAVGVLLHMAAPIALAVAVAALCVLGGML